MMLLDKPSYKTSYFFLVFISFSKIIAHLFFSTDVWDGLLFEGSHRNQSLVGPNRFFAESGWFTQKYLFHLTYNLANSFSVNHAFTSDLIAEVFLLFGCLCILAIARESKFPCIIGLSMALTFTFSPAAFSATSSVMLFHILTATGLLFSIWLYITQSTLCKVVILPIYVLVSGYHAWIILLPIYLLLIEWVRSSNIPAFISKISSPAQKGKFYILLFFFFVFNFIFYRLINAPYGQWTGYNQINIEFHSAIYSFVHSIRCLLNIWLIVPFLLLLQVPSRKHLIASIFGGIISTLLFGLISKSFFISPIFDFGDRQSIPLTVFICGVLPCLLASETGSRNGSDKILSKSRFCIAIIIPIVMFGFFSSNTLQFKNREIFMQDLVLSLKKNTFLLDSKKVNDLIIPRQPWGAVITGLEINQLFQTDTETAYWFESGLTMHHKLTNFSVKTTELEAIEDYLAWHNRPKLTLSVNEDLTQYDRNCIYVDQSGYSLEEYFRGKLLGMNSATSWYRSIDLRLVSCEQIEYVDSRY